MTVSPAGVLILVTLFVWLAADLWFYLTGRETESAWLRAVSKRPALPFAAGVLVGHVFFTG